MLSGLVVPSAGSSSRLEHNVFRCGIPTIVASMSSTSYISILITLASLPFFAYLALITLSALVPRRRKQELVVSPRAPRFQFVIPAHDEEANIRSTVESCLSVTYDRSLYSIMVIADNCTDGTACIARAAGAEVL